VSSELHGSPSAHARQAAMAGARAASAGPVVADAKGLAVPYAGLATRTLALALDAAVIEGVALTVAVTVGLGLSLLHLPHDVNVVIAAVGGFIWILWSLGYFVFFWSTTGQTPGNRAMSIVVLDSRGRGRLKPRRALLRFLALCVGAAALLSGIVIMLWDGRRRCFHDYVARTLVLYAPSGPGAVAGGAAPVGSRVRLGRRGA
jgi:uncharacterized RDD family membrane protein YckC